MDNWCYWILNTPKDHSKMMVHITQVIVCLNLPQKLLSLNESSQVHSMHAGCNSECVKVPRYALNHVWQHMKRKGWSCMHNPRHCDFGGRRFKNKQAVRAHLRFCEEYRVWKGSWFTVKIFSHLACITSTLKYKVFWTVVERLRAQKREIYINPLLSRDQTLRKEPPLQRVDNIFSIQVS